MLALARDMRQMSALLAHSWLFDVAAHARLSGL